ncbi:MAG: enoyl-CoA hydratase/isomerase family protein [Phycisphaerales bacterium]|nr:enoyl-CoA hydratase/isomerase family protein [Phycisphaerales bacterium]
MNELATLTCDGPVATLTMHRPEARNALSTDLLKGLHDRLGEIPDDMRVLVLTGEGRSFCAGMDLKTVMSDPKACRDLLRSLATLTVRLRALPQVTVARVNGAAIGGGCGLVCVTDFAVTHDDAKLGYPEVDLGLCPAVVAPWLVRRVGAGRAREILLKGGTFSGARAAEVGLVTESVASRDDLDDATGALVARIASGGPNALRATKALLNEVDGSLDEAMVLKGADLSADVLSGDEAQSSLRRAFGA